MKSYLTHLQSLTSKHKVSIVHNTDHSLQYNTMFHSIMQVSAVHVYSGVSLESASWDWIETNNYYSNGGYIYSGNYVLEMMADLVIITVLNQ